MFQTFISRHNSNFFSDKLVLTSVTPASSAPVLQTPKATSSTLYFDSLTVNAGNGGFLHCIQMDTSVNAANQVVSVGADIAFDADPKFFACLVRFESSSVPTNLQTAYDVYPFDGRHDGCYYTVKDCVTIDVLPSFPTRRSSDLRSFLTAAAAGFLGSSALAAAAQRKAAAAKTAASGEVKTRSEEHTSELQSPDHLVCRLLLEKKNVYLMDGPHAGGYYTVQNCVT